MKTINPNLMMSFIIGMILMVTTQTTKAQDGYCMVNGTTTGGTGGTTVTVTNATDFKTYATSSSKYIINVSGTIDLGGSVQFSNKTIQGVNTSSTIFGNLDCKENVIVKNINITSPYGDGVTLWTANHCYINHVTFYDCTDGCCDITQGSEYITVSYCKFYYDQVTDHRFTMILGNTDDGDYNVSIHHNWWSTNCDQRMPSGSYSHAHIYNNYFSCSGNSYCTNARIGTTWLVENNYYNGVADPCYYENGGIMDINNNSYNNCSGTISSSNGTVSVAYSYSLDAVSNVPSIVQAQAGNISSTTNSTISGTYSILAYHSGKALDCYAWGTTDGTNICQWSYWGGDVQKFIITPVDGIWHRITPYISTGQAIDVYGISTENGANINTWSYWGGYGQQFRFQVAGSGRWRIINRNSEKCLDVSGASTDDGANVLQWTCTSGSTWQMFTLTKHSSSVELSGVEDISAEAVSAYPNPAKDVININLNGSLTSADLTVYDMAGKQVLVTSLNDTENQVNISSLASGMYIVKLINGNQVFDSKFVKE